MRSFVSKYKHLLLLLLVFVVAELIVNPFGNFPLNDDWTYGKSELILMMEGKVNVGDFAAMTLLSHLLWGFLFVKTFGFSFTILRISTLISSLIGLFTLNKLIISFTQNRLIALLACLCLLLNPIYFNLSNTFMTDVNFNTLLLLGCYFACDFFRSRSLISFLLVFVMSALLVLLRQFGIILPACFLMACCFTGKKKWLYTGGALLGLILVYATFKYYEHYLKGVLSSFAAYKFSGNVDPTRRVFWDIFFYNWSMRYKQILLHILAYAFPFALVFLKAVLRNSGYAKAMLVFLLSFGAVYFLFQSENFPIGNIFSNMSVGTETFYESLSLEPKSYKQHTWAPDFEHIMLAAKYVCSAVTLSLLVLALLQAKNFRSRLQQLAPERIFLILLFAAYVFMILITESYFDRYHLPLITLTLLLMSVLTLKFEVRYKPAIIIFACLFYISAFGTKDYLELNRTKWKAYAYLMYQKHIAPDKINGGFEINCWNNGKPSWWYDYLNLDNFDYLIQYRTHDGFRFYKSFPFQRYFPYEEDKVNIFVREGKYP